MNQSKLEVITGSRRKARENACGWVRLVLVLLLIGWKIGPNFLGQSCSVTNAKPIAFRHSNENRSNLDNHLVACRWGLSWLGVGCQWLVIKENSYSIVSLEKGKGYLQGYEDVLLIIGNTAQEKLKTEDEFWQKRPNSTWWLPWRGNQTTQRSTWNIKHLAKDKSAAILSARFTE